MLADHGADVVKIEPPWAMRRGSRPAVRCGGAGGVFWRRQPRKRGMALDLSRAEGRVVLEALLKDADPYWWRIFCRHDGALASDTGSIVGAVSADGLLRHFRFRPPTGARRTAWL